jgi:hypothetical protein
MAKKKSLFPNETVKNLVIASGAALAAILVLQALLYMDRPSATPQTQQERSAQVAEDANEPTPPPSSTVAPAP